MKMNDLIPLDIHLRDLEIPMEIKTLDEMARDWFKNKLSAAKFSSTAAYKAGYEKANEWVSVKDSLPGWHINVLCSSGDDIFIHRFYTGRPGWTSFKHRKVLFWKTITGPSEETL